MLRLAFLSKRGAHMQLVLLLQNTVRVVVMLHGADCDSFPSHICL